MRKVKVHDKKNKPPINFDLIIDFHSRYGRGDNTKAQFNEYKFYKQLNLYLNSMVNSNA